MRNGAAALERMDSALIDSLRSPDSYRHTVESIELIETHVSWVVLTGAFAYKIKKPIKLGFLDFRELEDRRFYCEEELRLNRRWAPEIYLDVVPISMHACGPLVGGDGPPVEYAVRMRQFDQERRLDIQLEMDELSLHDMDELANNIALRHGSADIVGPAGRMETLSLIEGAMWDNLDALEGQLPARKMQALRNWTAESLDTLDPVLRQRFDDGCVRECHGDLHLTNLVRLPSGITAFDCLEFSTDLRNTDVMADVAFLVMDLVSRRRPDLAYRFLNRYLEVTGDYGGMKVFALYFVYRCLVRAKVALIRSRERQRDSDATVDLSRVLEYCNMALRETRHRTPLLVVMHGLSGSGKTRLSSRLLSALPAVRIRSDIERKRLVGLGESADSGSGVAQGIYSEAVNRDVYRRLHRLAATTLRAGHDVILDASYLKSLDREHARRIAAASGAGVVFLHTTAPVSVLRDRILIRASGGRQPSEADIEVLEYQLDNVEELSPAEQGAAVEFDTREVVNAEDVCRRLRQCTAESL
ncbi:MAG: AAA family ATPase [Woeseia sp.]